MERAAVFCAALAFQISTVTLGQQGPNSRGKATLPGGKVTVDYGRPSTRGRDVMAMIAPGSYWRMGADVATTMTTQADLKFGSVTVPKGSYTLVAHFVASEKWNLVVCKDTGDGFQPVDTVAEVPGVFEKSQPHVEQLTINLEQNGGKATLVLLWGSYRLSADFKTTS